jgi:hypothetical protein
MGARKSAQLSMGVLLRHVEVIVSGFSRNLLELSWPRQLGKANGDLAFCCLAVDASVERRVAICASQRLSTLLFLLSAGVARVQLAIAA